MTENNTNSPRKLYIAGTTFPDMIDWEGSPINTKRVDESDIEYVRKDVVVDLIKEMQDDVYGGEAIYWREGYSYALETLMEKLNTKLMTARDLAKKFLDEILYDGDWINRWNPFDEKKHYGDWVYKFEVELKPVIETLGIDFFDDDFIMYFCCGDYDDAQAVIEANPCLGKIYSMLDEYHDWLCETID